MIHKEGYKLLSALLIAFILIEVLVWKQSTWLLVNCLISLIGLFTLLFVAFFFRKPRNRIFLADDNAIVAPADGLVVSVDREMEDQNIQTEEIKGAIFMAGTDIHINWAPVTGEIDFFRYLPGKHFFARNPKSSSKNERTMIAIKHSTGHSVFVNQIAGFMARRVVSYVKPGAQLNQGSEMGFIKFGSRLETFLPAGSELRVQPGERVVGGVTILGFLPPSC